MINLVERAMVSFEVGKKKFEVKFEGSHVGTWILLVERSRGRVSVVGFEREEIELVQEQLKKAVEMKAYMGFIRKFRGKTRTHILKICFNSQGRYIQVMEFVTKRSCAMLVVLERGGGSGWKVLREAISSVLSFCNSPSKEVFQGKHFEGNSYNGSRSFAEVVADGEPTRGALTPVRKWERTVICERKKMGQD